MYGKAIPSFVDQADRYSYQIKAITYEYLHHSFALRALAHLWMSGPVVPSHDDSLVSIPAIVYSKRFGESHPLL